MPYMTNGKRDYKKEYEKYAGKTGAKKDRAQRNKARRMMVKAGKAKKGDGKDIGRKTALSKGGGNTLMNLFVQDRTSNRSFSRTKSGSMRSERSKRGR